MLLVMDTCSISSKASVADVYTKTEVNSALSTKANQSTTCTKIEVDDVVGAKANESDMAIGLGGKVVVFRCIFDK